MVPNPAGTPSNGSGETDRGRTATINLPFVTAQVRVPQLGRPRLPHVPAPRVSRQEMGALARGAGAMLPAPKEMAYYAGLGALAALELIEWPVAVAIGAGTVVARQSAKKEQQSAVGRSHQPALPTAGEPATGRRAASGEESPAVAASAASAARSGQRRTRPAARKTATATS